MSDYGTNVRLQVVARILIEAKERMERHAADIRAVQKATGRPVDTRADYAEGSAAAYAYAMSALSGAFGTTIEVMAGEWDRPRGMLPPVLPDDKSATTFAPGDSIAAASVIASRLGDHFAYPGDDKSDDIADRISDATRDAILAETEQ